MEFKRISVAKLSDELFIAIINTVDSFYIQKFNSNLDKAWNFTYILLDSIFPTEEIISHSVAFIDTFINIILTLNDDENYRMTMTLPECNNNIEYNIIDNQQQDFQDFGETDAINQMIVIIDRNTETPSEIVGISLYIEYPLDKTFGFLIGSKYVYTFTVLERIGNAKLYSGNCTVTFNACDDSCNTSTGYGND